MKSFFVALIAALSAATSVQAFELACDATDGCAVGGPASGTYHLALPRDWTNGSGNAEQKLLVFFHGHGGSGRGVLRNKGLISIFTSAGYVVIAPDAAAIPGRKVRGWPARPDTDGARDDIVFTETVLKDAAKRLGVAKFDILMSGFSSGGSMAWHFACYSPVTPNAIVAVAGGLRRPIPAEKCPAGPQRLLQIHGFADNQVPLEGRGIRNWHQGDVFEGLTVLRNTNLCRSRPDELTINGPFWCREWTSCESGEAIRFCLHKGGHSMPKGWARQAVDWHLRGK